MRKTITKMNKVLALLLVCTLLVGTFAVFVDRVSTNATVETVEHGVEIVPTVPDPDEFEPGDIDDPTKDPEDYVDPTPNNPDDDLSNWWAWLNSRALGNFNPGDKLTFNYTLNNTGTLAVDVRETFIVKSDVALTDVDAQTGEGPEFRVFTAYTKDHNGANFGVNVVVKEEKIDAYTYKYSIAPYVVSGSDETVDNISTVSSKDYYLVFDFFAVNKYQQANCSVTYVVEAKQHTSVDADWVTVATADLTVGGDKVLVGGDPVKVVPAL